jgi:hypothetical protein
VFGLEAFAKCVQRACANVAINDTDGGERQFGETSSLWSSFGMVEICQDASSTELPRSTPGAENPKATVN